MSVWNIGAHMCSPTHACVHMCRGQRTALGVIPQTPTTLWVFSWLFNLWDKIFPWHRAHQADKADWPVSPCILPDSTSAILGLHHMLPIPSRSRESNSDSHDYKVSTLTLLSPLPSSWSSFNQHNFRVMEFSCCALGLNRFLWTYTAIT